jgi:hypothetical protein
VNEFLFSNAKMSAADRERFTLPMRRRRRGNNLGVYFCAKFTRNS